MGVCGAGRPAMNSGKPDLLVRRRLELVLGLAPSLIGHLLSTLLQECARIGSVRIDGRSGSTAVVVTCSRGERRSAHLLLNIARLLQTQLDCHCSLSGSLIRLLKFEGGAFHALLSGRRRKWSGNRRKPPAGRR